MTLVRTALANRGAALVILGAVIVVVGFATGTVQRIDKTDDPEPSRVPAPPNLVLTPSTQAFATYTQIDAYSHGYRCVKAALSTLAQTRRTARATQRFVVGCDRRAKDDHVAHLSWYR